MKNLVMLVGGYYPNPSPTGKCAEQYISLVQDKYEITVLCIGNQHFRDYSYEYNGKKVYALSNWRPSLEHWFNNRQQKKCNFLSKAGVILCKAIGWVQGQICYPNNLFWLWKKQLKKLEELNSTHTIDIVFSVAAPFASHIAAQIFKKRHPEILWITYTVDSYAAQNKGTYKYRKAQAAEINNLKNADINFVSEEIFQQNEEIFNENRISTIVLPYLMNLGLYDLVQSSKSHRNIVAVYAGRFYEKIRNPRIPLKILSLINNVVCYFYTEGECQALVDRFARDSSDRIVRRDMVNIDKLTDIYSEADVLISVGNNLKEFQPSKVYEYISTGKPVIHFYYPGNRDRILDKYQLAIQIEISEGNEITSAERISKFLLESSKERIPKSDIQISYINNCEYSVRETILSAIHDYECLVEKE